MPNIHTLLYRAHVVHSFDELISGILELLGVYSVYHSFCYTLITITVIFALPLCSRNWNECGQTGKNDLKMRTKQAFTMWLLIKVSFQKNISKVFQTCRCNTKKKIQVNKNCSVFQNFRICNDKVWYLNYICMLCLSGLCGWGVVL